MTGGRSRRQVARPFGIFYKEFDAKRHECTLSVLVGAGAPFTLLRPREAQAQTRSGPMVVRADPGASARQMLVMIRQGGRDRWHTVNLGDGAIPALRATVNDRSVSGEIGLPGSPRPPRAT